MRAGPEAAKPGRCCFKAKTGAVLPKTAEIELSVLAKQCLADHVTSMDNLKEDLQLRAGQRNDRKNTVAWRFSTDGARTKLKRLYPSGLPR